MQKNVTRQQIDCLELNGRNPIFMANLVPGTRGGNLAGLSFNFSQGPSNINGARTPESLITYDGAPAVRTRSNGTSLGAADVDSTQEIQILTADYAAGIRPLLRRRRSASSRRSGTSSSTARLTTTSATTLFNANTWTRNHTAGQPLHRRRFNYNQFGYNVGGPFYIPGQVQHRQDQDLLVLGPGMGALPLHRHQQPVTVPTAADAPGQLQRTAESDQRLLRQGGARSRIRPRARPFAGNIIPQESAQPERPRHSEGLSRCPTWRRRINGNQNWYSAR